MNARAELWRRASNLIERSAEGRPDDATRDALLADLADYQAQHVVSYGRVVAALGEQAALATDVFRFARVSSRPESEITHTFRTSGTTHGARGEHHFADLSLYERAALAAGKRWLFPDVERIDMVILAPRAEESPDSSLTHMLELYAARFGARVTWAWRDGALLVDALEEALGSATAPVAILGTSFALVHAMERSTSRFALPGGSRLMQTGGYKGRSRELSPEAMRAELVERFGIPEAMIVAEYGMTELSSQAWENTLREHLLGEPASSRRLRFMPWVRARVVDPRSLAPGVDEGLLRVDDPANVDSVSAVLTSDLVRAEGDGFVVLGRSADAVPRGCSLAIEEALGR